MVGYLIRVSIADIQQLADGLDPSPHGLVVVGPISQSFEFGLDSEKSFKARGGWSCVRNDPGVSLEAAAVVREESLECASNVDEGVAHV